LTTQHAVRQAPCRVLIAFCWLGSMHTEARKVNHFWQEYRTGVLRQGVPKPGQNGLYGAYSGSHAPDLVYRCAHKLQHVRNRLLRVVSDRKQTDVHVELGTNMCWPPGRFERGDFIRLTFTCYVWPVQKWR
jgi:hypothetical protein